MKKDGQGPLRLRFAEDEWASRVSRFIVSVAERYTLRPEFKHLSVPDIIEYLAPLVPKMLEPHITSDIVFEEDVAGWTGYTAHSSINDSDLCADLAAAAYEHFVLGPKSPSLNHDQPASALEKQ